jgi:hypothetical protein
MNIRLAHNALRYRVTRSELDGLLAGRSLALEVSLPRNHAFRTSVRPALLGGWQLESDPTGMWLSVPRLDLEALAASLPSKEGIEHRFIDVKGSGLLVTFEVDLKDKS